VDAAQLDRPVDLVRWQTEAGKGVDQRRPDDIPQVASRENGFAQPFQRP